MISTDIRIRYIIYKCVVIKQNKHHFGILIILSDIFATTTLTNAYLSRNVILKKFENYIG